MPKDITDSIRYLKGVGPARSMALEKLGIRTAEDLLGYFPRRYEDRTNFSKISALKANHYQGIQGRVLTVSQHHSFRSRSLKIFEAIVEDDTANLACVWFNQPYVKNYLKAGKEVVLYGKIDIYDNHLQMQNPEYEIIERSGREHLDYGRIVPIYALSENISQRMFRRIVRSGLDEYLSSVADILPYDIRQRHNLVNTAEAILNLHFPQDAACQEAAYRRVVFEECFLLQLIFGFRRLKHEELAGVAHRPAREILGQFERSLPFELTVSQEKAIREIDSDMIRLRPMHRLLQGDVGSGKTIVALYACLIAVSSGHQAAFMVPTEILAEQHYQNIKMQLSDIKHKGRSLNVGLLTSGLNKKTKEKIYSDINKGRLDILIGTHAIIQEGLDFKDLSLVVIDEQHKFGVYQRVNALAKGINPDCLIMTATPIPRTLAMTIYADLDISTISELPKGRLPVETRLVSEERRTEVYSFIQEKVKSGRQVYIVYPIIDESSKLDLKAANSMYEDLSKNIFSDFKVGLVHGRMKQQRRNLIMQEFKDGRIDILVSTILIEVGIDVPNASVMVIEHAERFGLSQLHQLRGRIGRGPYLSHCILFGEAVSEEAALRLKAISEESDGFEISDRDLLIRGPGEFFGIRQHGITELRVNPLTNLESISIAKEEAQRLLARDQTLSTRQNQGLAHALRKRFPNYEKLLSSS